MKRGYSVHIPKVTLGSHAEILQDKPDAIFILGVYETKCASGEAAN